MAHRTDIQPDAGRLAQLLDIERRLEARVREAEQSAASRIEAAREASRCRTHDRRAELEATALAEERADLESHAAELRRIAEEGAARVERLSSVPEVEIDRMAHRTLAAVLEREEVGGP